MTAFDGVAVIGLGLMGGSVARDLAAEGVRVRAYDPDPAHLADAVRTNIVETALDASLDGVRGAEVVIIAVPVDVALDVLRLVAPHATRARLITDVGSTKVRIVEAASSLGMGDRFVGSHPMAGDHRSGWHASRNGLFRQARVFLCPAREATAEAIGLAHRLWRDVGANPERMDAEAHDRKLAWISHLPHLVSAALGLALARGGVRHGELGPGGLDVTRLAGSSPEVWTAIAGENAAAIDTALREAEREIAGFRRALETADATALRDRFIRARAWFDE